MNENAMENMDDAELQENLAALLPLPLLPAVKEEDLSFSYHLLRF